MILVCSGDSFTHGMELWEEKHMPGYTEIKTQKEAFAVRDRTLTNEDARLKLAWPHSLAQLLSCSSINVGEDGCSELSITQKTIKKLSEVRQEFPKEKIICVMQDTELERIWIWYEKFKINLNMSVASLESYYPGDKLEAYELKNIYLTRQPGEMLLSEYYLQGLAVRNFCVNNDIQFLHFQMFRNWKKTDYQFKNLEFSMIEKLYLDPKYTVKDNMSAMLVDYYQHDNFVLPGLHVNCEAQTIIAKLIYNELLVRGIV